MEGDARFQVGAMSFTRRIPLMDRFMSMVSPEPNSGCWLWMGSCLPFGYGQISQGRGLNPGRAHVVSYKHFVGLIPEGLVLDHLCRNPSCVNPMHLEPVTRGENVRRGFRWGPEVPRNQPRGWHGRYVKS